MNLTLEGEGDNNTIANRPVFYLSDSNLPNAHVKNVHFSENGGGYSVNFLVNDHIFSGTYEELTGRGGFYRQKQVYSGTWKNCTLNHGWGNRAYPYTETTGVIKNCETTEKKFSGDFIGKIYGTIDNCVAHSGNDYSFGGGLHIYSGAVISNCVGLGDYCFGRFVDSGALLINCRGGRYSFGTHTGSPGAVNGTCINCVGGANSFAGGSNAALTGECHNCIGDSGSFTSSQTDEMRGQLYYCRLTSGTFATPKTGDGGFYRLCIDGNGDINNTGPITS